MELRHGIEIVCLLIALWLVWGFTGIIDGYYKFKSMPNGGEMFWCHKHGAFSKKHVLPLLSTTVCPRCYREAWKNAESGKVKT